MSEPPNPFDRFSLDPTSGLVELTEALRERAESLPDEERPALRAAWEALTLHPRRRLELALTAVPETRTVLGVPPPRAQLPPSPRAHEDLSLLDLVDVAPLGELLGEPSEAERALFAPRRVVAPK